MLPGALTIITVGSAQQAVPFNDRKEKPATPAVYSLDKCYEVALAKNPAISQAQNIIKANLINYKTSRYGILPSLDYNIGHYFSFGKNIDPVTNTFSHETFSGGYTGLGLDLSIFSGFRRVNTVKQNTYNIHAAEYGKKRAELELLTNITAAYVRLLLDNEELVTRRKNIENTTKEIEAINEKIQVGKLSKYEFYTFNARLQTEQADLITWNNDSLAALFEIKRLLNLPDKEAIGIEPIDTSVLAGVYDTNFDNQEEIINAHPAIKQAEMNEQVARMGEKIAKSDFFPTLSVSGNIVSNYSSDQTDVNGGKLPFPTQINSNLGQNININLSIPIFSKRETVSRVKIERLRAANAQLDIQETRNAVGNNIRNLVNEFNGMKERYKAMLSAYEQNTLMYALYSEKYKLGQISSVELLAAKDILNTSASRYLQTKLQLFLQYQLLKILQKY